MEKSTARDYKRAPPLKSALGAWLLEKARELRGAINKLTSDAAAGDSEIQKLKVLVNHLL